ncbi:hypothetical protein JXQ31_03210 [candidate division KSB1 bacterium]|nr:hypothetical protein [candidate division KSB1 bacterium]
MYTLEAILAQKATLHDAAAGFSNVRLIPLHEDICIIPMAGGLLQELENRYQGGTKVTRPESQQFSASLFHPIFERLIVGVDQFARHLSHKGLVAYVEATFIGGYGGHATMLWEYGERLEPPGDNINTVLKQLGVVCGRGLDEFETVGLKSYKSTKQWLEAWDGQHCE